ncbi:MAG TPA: glycosyltransferase family 1 protein [Candidatus Saccharimonadales bacterium]|nr:glycosyltransferase family 1 protein [Candidatus Saccharimonadales bacterium]
MIIGVDAGCLGIIDSRLKAGVYYVAYNLFRELSLLDTKNKYILYSFHPLSKELMQQFSPSWENTVLSSKGWLSVSLPLAFRKQKPNIFLAISQAMPWYHPITIGFIHGLDFLPEFHEERNKKLKSNSEYMIHHADKLITTSQFLKESLVRQYHKKNIFVSPLGADQNFFTNEKKHTEQVSYFLFIGTLKPSKNIPRLLKAFSLFLKTTKKEYKLLLIGSDFWLDKRISETIKNLQLEKHISLIPFLENKSLSSYYKGATAFVSPSLYEGFGLPFVEAMASGCPVIGSTAGAIPEIVGDAGILVDPLDVEGLANTMERVSAYTSLRLKMKEAGIKRAKQFTWENFAKGVFSIINRV